MKKYNLSNIMKRAWILVKNNGMTISVALKRAWKEAKNMAKKTFESFAKIVIPGRESREDESAALSFKLWERGSKRRIYINDYKRRTLGFIDLCEDNKVVINDNQGLGNDEVNGTLDRFFETYEF